MATYKSVFLGQRMFKKYYVGYSTGHLYVDIQTGETMYGFLSEPELGTRDYLDGYMNIHECEFEEPPLEIGEKVYIKELNITAVVEDRARSTSGEYVYYLDHIVETVENEKTEESREKAKKELELTLKEYEEQKKRLEEARKKPKQQSSAKKKKWWQLYREVD